MAEKYLYPSDIPQPLWDGESTLSLPPPLGNAYRETLKMVGLLEEASKAHSPGTIGGESKEETDEHFAKSFSGSCARTQLAILDPKSVLGVTSDYFVNAFSGGRVRLLDIPCGCGAASATLLATVAELRRENIVPREPLDVFLTGGDISDTARSYADLMSNELQQDLRDQGIFLEYSFHSWDITEAASTTSFLDKWLTDSPFCEKSFLLIANWTGFLGDQNNRKKSEGQMDDVFQWAEENECAIAWLEPPMKENVQMWILELFKRVVIRLRNLFGKQEEPTGRLIAKLKFIHPIRGTPHTVRLQIGGLGGLTR